VTKKSFTRFWEIDLLRGIAIVMMIIFHSLYYLNYFNIYKMSLYSGPILIYVYLVGTIFILLVGVSLSLSYSRVENLLAKKDLRLKYVKRGFTIFCLGLFITVVTWFYVSGGFVVFGVLHCIGLSIILAYPFLRFRYQNLFLGIFLIVIGVILRDMVFDFNWLVWLGFMPSNFYSIDYFPLLPWFGVVLVGIFLGNSLYHKYKRVFSLRDFSGLKPFRFFCFLGRYSLIIYFLHHIILLFIMYILLAL
jgi:uncharacterized membrane protein